MRLINRLSAIRPRTTVFLVVIAAVAVCALLNFDISRARQTPEVRHEETSGREALLEARRREILRFARRACNTASLRKPCRALSPRCMRWNARWWRVLARRWAVPASRVLPLRRPGPSSVPSRSWKNPILPARRSEARRDDGSMTAIAVDSTGLIMVAGAASGGLWVSTNNGGSFASVFDSQPTQAIGAIALDTTTNPSTIYVGTGEGNNSIDSLYGGGDLQILQSGGALDRGGSTGTFDHASFTSLAIDTHYHTRKATDFCGHHQWIQRQPCRCGNLRVRLRQSRTVVFH